MAREIFEKTGTNAADILLDNIEKKIKKRNKEC